MIDIDSDEKEKHEFNKYTDGACLVFSSEDNVSVFRGSLTKNLLTLISTIYLGSEYF